MYGKDRKWYQSLKLTCGSIIPFYPTFVTDSKNMKLWSAWESAKQCNRLIEHKEKTTTLQREVFERQGSAKKVFHEVWRVDVGRFSALEDSQCLGLCRAAYIAIIFFPRHLHHSFSSWDLKIIERLTQRHCKDVRFCQLHLSLEYSFKLSAAPWVFNLSAHSTDCTALHSIWHVKNS